MVKRLNGELEFFEQHGVDVVVVTTQARAVLEKFQSRTGWAVRFLGDTSRAITVSYNVLDRGGLLEAFILKTRYPVKSLFLITHEGIVSWRFIAADKTDNPVMDTIKAAIERLPSPHA